jgi:hypothetical protein
MYTCAAPYTSAHLAAFVMGWCVARLWVRRALDPIDTLVGKKE